MPTLAQWVATLGADPSAKIVDTVSGILAVPTGGLLGGLLSGLLGGGGSITATVANATEMLNLTPTDIGGLVTRGTSLINPGSATSVPLLTGVAMGAANTIGFVGNTVTTALGTATEVTNLDTAAIQDLAGIGIDIISAGGGAVTMTLDEVTAMLGADMVLGSLDVGTLVGTAAGLAGLTIQGILDLLDLGIEIIDVTDGPIYITVAQALTFAQVGIKFSADDAVIIRDTSVNIQAMTVVNIGAVDAIGVDSIDALDDKLALSAAQIDALAAKTMALDVSDTVALLDTAANIAALSTTRLSSLAAQGVDLLDATDNVLGLTLAQVNAISNAGLKFATNDTVTLRDSVATLGALTAQQLQSLGTLGVDKLDVIGDQMTLTAAKAKAIAASGLGFVADDVVTIADTGAAIAGLTAAEFTSLKTAGIDTIDATNDAVSLTLAQAAPLIGGTIAFAEGDVVTVTGSAVAMAALAVADLTDLGEAGIDFLDTTENAVSLTLAAAKTLATVGLAYAANDVVSVVGLGTEIATLTAEGMEQLSKAGVDVLDAIDDKVILTATAAKSFVEGKMLFHESDLVTIADTGANITKLTAANLTDLAAAGVDVIDITDNELALSFAQFKSFIDSGFTFAVDDVVTLADTGANITALTVTQIGNLATAGVDKLDATNNVVTLAMDQVQAFRTAGIAFTAADTIALATTGAEVRGYTAEQLTEFKGLGIDAFDLTDNRISLSVDAWLALGDFGFGANDTITVTGGSGKEQLVARGVSTVVLDGLGGKDTLRGGAETTILDGGKGKDKLYGADGFADQFLFDTKPGNRNFDKVFDFTRGEDKVILDNDVFRAIGPSLTRKEFYVGSEAHDGSDRLIYDKANGALYYDQDGIGGRDAVKIATFEHGLKLGLADFEII